MKSRELTIVLWFFTLISFPAWAGGISSGTIGKKTAIHCTNQDGSLSVGALLNTRGQLEGYAHTPIGSISEIAMRIVEPDHLPLGTRALLTSSQLTILVFTETSSISNESHVDGWRSQLHVKFDRQLFDDMGVCWLYEL